MRSSRRLLVAHLLSVTAVLPGLLVASTAAAQAPPAAGNTIVAPPANLAAVVVVPKAAGAPPAAPPPAIDSTNVGISAGGQYAAGNSQLGAATASGKFDIRRGNNAFGASILGNYSRAFVTPPAMATAPGAPAVAGVPGSWQTATENLQGKLRYDRYFNDNISIFLQLTGTHDAFQGITFRFNADPGAKFLAINTAATKLWGEVGYDFQYDQNYVAADGIEQAGSGGTLLNPQGFAYVIKSGDTIHSTRLFAGFQEAFNKDVTLSLGIEYLQGIGGSGGGTPPFPANFGPTNAIPVSIGLTAARLNGNALLAANVGAGFSIGVGLTGKYNSEPLPGKLHYDSTGTLSLIYAFGTSKAEPPKCPPDGPPAEPPPPPPPPPPAAAPAPAAPAPAPAPPAAPAPAPAPPAAPAPAPAPAAPAPAPGG